MEKEQGGWEVEVEGGGGEGEPDHLTSSGSIMAQRRCGWRPAATMKDGAVSGTRKHPCVPEADENTA